jgi:hypothetical protein
MDLAAVRPLDSRRWCPSWCAAEHGVQVGEEDWVHLSAPVFLTEEVTARLCMSTDPVNGAFDGPFVLIGTREYTLEEAAALGFAITDIAATGRRPIAS